MDGLVEREGGALHDGQVSRTRFLGRAAAAMSATAAGGAAITAFASASGAKLSARDREILQFALTLERLQDAFYAEAVHSGKLTGQVRQFAEVVGREEHAHLEYLLEELGSSAGKATSFHFGDATTSNHRFIEAAVTLEDTGLAAYNGQAENLSRATLRSVARVISVEARHAAWARGIAGLLPAPVAADVPISAAQAMDAVQKYLA